MKFDIRESLRRWTSSERREILYFLFRYFKQAPFLEKDGKDVFDDVFDRSPSPGIREATISMVAEIEARLGVSAFALSDEQANRVLNLLVEAGEKLKSVPTDEQASKAAVFFQRFN